MPKEKWLIDPAELDHFQRQIRGFGLDESYIIKGRAGSGKTILALYRANDVRLAALAENPDTYPSFTVVVYTKALRSFITSGIRELGLNIRQVVYFKNWDQDPVDYIIADEVQDFTKEQIDDLVTAKKVSIMLYGDSQQQLYEGRMSIEEIETHLRLPTKELLLNYRLPKTLAAFASHVGNDKDMESSCVKLGNEKPKLKKFPSWKEELDYIISEIKTRNLTDVGIFLPFNTTEKARKHNGYRNLQSVKEYFDSQDFVCQYKIREDEEFNDLDFDSDQPKVISFHSSKGLQFESVFIPFCDWPNYFNWFSSVFRQPLYVALTRSYRSLYLTYSGNLAPLLTDIPHSKFDK